jgi:hypothetical protein
MSQKQLRILAISLGVISGLLLYSFALPYSPPEASGWWQVVLIIVGLPVLLDQLNKIQEEAKKSQWKPEINIGWARFPLPEPYFKKEDLETQISSTSRNVSFSFHLVIQNHGQLAARYVKIRLDFKSFEEKLDIPHLTFPKGNLPRERDFEKSGEKDYIFHGGADWVIYPHDAEVFLMRLVLREHGKPMRVGNYSFHCTVWAEGLENRVEKDLIVSITEN